MARGAMVKQMKNQIERHLLDVRPFKGVSPKVEKDCYVDKTAVLIGKVTVGKDSSVWPNAVVRGDAHEISIGERTSVQDNSCLHVTHKGPFTGEGHALKIGDDVTVGHSVNLHGCSVGDRVIIGIGSTVLDGAVIESDVMIGAHSLVPPDARLASGHLYLGSPAKQSRRLMDKEKEFLKYSAENYVRLSRTFSAEAKQEVNRRWLETRDFAAAEQKKQAELLKKKKLKAKDA
ncbi:Protein YrdA [Diplonema papillatum]|nr:Protein YrdA [Diplonema papillatum]